MKKNKEKNTVAESILSDEDDIEATEESEMHAEAVALRQAIKDGVFDKLNISTKGKSILDKRNDDDKNCDDNLKDRDDDDDVDDDDNESGSDNDEEKEKEKRNGIIRNKALVVKTKELLATKEKMPWLETFDIIPEEPLPFSKHNGGNPLHVHDDLKREVSFYNVALEAVQKAKRKCFELKVPFTRPDDFFAEMVKTDEHMAKVKDRLIFESKKIEAYEQRKSNKEQKLRAKEARSKKLQEKAKHKKDNLKAVDTWAKSAASNRLSDGKIRDGDDQQYLQNMYDNKPNKKREMMNKKYGFGGKRGRFKQTDPKVLNDLSDFNPYGNFGGVGSKKRSGAATSNKRAGKRARDARKQKR